MVEKSYLYEALAEKIVFGGITVQQLESIADYKSRKSFSDVEELMERAGEYAMLGTEGLFGYLSSGLKEIVDLNLERSELEYERMIREL